MIYYISDGWGLLYIFRLRGSVLPKAFAWAIPSAGATILYKYYQVDLDITGVQDMWGGFTFVLGFMIVFRNNQAYMRFWEGATLIQQVRGEWFNAVSSIIAFCNSSQDKATRKKVEEFQHLLIRLVSLLYCCALQQVAMVDDKNFDVIDNSGLDQESLVHLANSIDRCEILLQWVQRLIVDGLNAGTIQIAPPILSRSFQELSRGIVNLNNVRKIKEIPLPFPYSQASTVMLLMHWIFQPIFASQSIENYWCAAITSCLTTAAFWALNYIAQEIEQPFGEDPNDLPIGEMQMDMNRSLCVLLHPRTQAPPRYSFEKSRDTVLAVRPSDLDNMVSNHEPERISWRNNLHAVGESQELGSQCSGSSNDHLTTNPTKASVVSTVGDLPDLTGSAKVLRMSETTGITNQSRNSVQSANVVVGKNSTLKTVHTVISSISRTGKKQDSSYSKLVKGEKAKAVRRNAVHTLRASEGIIGEKKESVSWRVGRPQEAQQDGDPDVAEETDLAHVANHHRISRGGIRGQRASWRGLANESMPVPCTADTLLAIPASHSQGKFPRGGSTGSTDTDMSCVVVARGSVLGSVGELG